MMDIEKQYLDLLRLVLSEGIPTPDRTGVGTSSIFGVQLRHDMRLGFPLLRTKRVWFKGVKGELLWFLKGTNDASFLKEHSIKIWDPWIDENNEVELMYGNCWRRFGYADPCIHPVDQIAEVIEGIKRDPYSRRHLVTAWDPTMLGDVALPSCHYAFQFHVTPTPQGKPLLSLMYQQRSVDLVLGLPFNIASYALLLSMVAQICDTTPHELIFTGGNSHIYNTHTTAVKTQLNNMVWLEKPLPKLILDPEVKCIDSFTMDNIKIIDYESAEKIVAPIAV